MASGKIIVLATDSAGLDLTQHIFPTIQCLQKERSGMPADIWLFVDDKIEAALPYVKLKQNGIIDELFISDGRVGWPIALGVLMDEIAREEYPPEFLGLIEAGVMIEVKDWLSHALEMLHEGEGAFAASVGIHGDWEETIDPQKSMHMHDNVFTVPRIMGMCAIVPWFRVKDWRPTPYLPLYYGIWEELTDHLVQDMGMMILTNAAWDKEHGIRHSAGQRLMIDTCAGFGIFPIQEEMFDDAIREVQEAPTEGKALPDPDAVHETGRGGGDPEIDVQGSDEDVGGSSDDNESVQQRIMSAQSGIPGGVPTPPPIPRPPTIGGGAS